MVTAKAIVFFSIVCTTAFARAETQKTISIPFPKTASLPRSVPLFCDSILSTSIEAFNKDSPWAKTNGKPGVYSNTSTGRERLVLEMFGGDLYFHNRTDFIQGKSQRGIPVPVVVDNDAALIAIDQGQFLNGYSVVVVTVNRNTGLGTWTSTRTVAPLMHQPDVQTHYLSCRDGKE